MTTTTCSRTAIKIGNVHYDIEVSKIPYLSSFVNFQKNAQPQSKEFVHDPIPLFDVALKGIESGYRQCFRSLPADISQYHTLCDTFEFLCIDVLGGQSFDGIFNDLKIYQADFDFEGDKSEARDAAFKLLYVILLGEFEDETKDSAKVFNAVLYVVSHPRIFKWRTRSSVRAAYEERFILSTKQRARLDQWETANIVEPAADEDDNTTDEEMYDSYYISDDS